LKLKNKPNLLLIELYNAYFNEHNSWIGFNSEFEGIPCFPHGPKGVFISNDAIVGSNVVIFHQVTIGSNTLNGSEKKGSPRIGNNVYIGSGAKIIGNISIGNNCRIGANAVVYNDMTDNSVAVQSPTRIIKKSEEMDNRFFSKGKNNDWYYYNNGNWVSDSFK